MTRLNLGAGRAQFPTTPDNPIVAHLTQYLPPSAYDPHACWLNVDAIPQAGIGQVADVFSYPWPWLDNSIEEIWASHIVEHIPHEANIKLSNIPAVGSVVDFGKRIGNLQRAAHSDGFYAWFYEAWRVLKPNGLIHIVCPYAFSVAGMSDPQHRRYITNASFGYLAPQAADAPFDYALPFAFEALGDPVLRIQRDMDLPIEEIRDRMWREIGFINEVSVVLRAVKT